MHMVGVTAGAGASKLGMRTTVAIVVTRLLLIPPMGIATVLTAEKMGFLPVGNKVFKFVLLLQHTMPSSILAGNEFLRLIHEFPRFLKYVKSFFVTRKLKN